MQNACEQENVQNSPWSSPFLTCYEWRHWQIIAGGMVVIFNHVCVQSMVMETPTDRTGLMPWWNWCQFPLLTAVTSLWHGTWVSYSCRMCTTAATHMRTGISGSSNFIVMDGIVDCHVLLVQQSNANRPNNPGWPWSNELHRADWVSWFVWLWKLFTSFCTVRKICFAIVSFFKQLSTTTMATNVATAAN